MKYVATFPFVFIAFFVLCAVSLFSVGYSESYIGCTDDAMVCSDGTVVSRTGPNCSFAPCPSAETVRRGTRHPWVLEVQRLLNQTRCRVSNYGAGSPGQETNYFGSKTHSALECYSDLGPPYFGVVTESLLDGLRIYVINLESYGDRFCSEKRSQCNTCTRIGSSNSWGCTEVYCGEDEEFYCVALLLDGTIPVVETVRRGTRHPWVLEVQRLLNQTRCRVSNYGAGSPGQETNYFGSKTHNALECYSDLGPPYFGVVTESLLDGLREYVGGIQSPTLMYRRKSRVYIDDFSSLFGD